MKHLTPLIILLFNSLILFGQYDVVYDSTFSDDGITYLPYSVTGSNAVYLQSDGKIILFGKQKINNDSSIFTVMRLEENGVLDGSYNNTGVNNDPTLFSNNSGQKGLLLPNNDLVVAGSGLPTPWYSSSAILYKYRENGTKDESFGNSGVVIFTIDSLPLGCRDLIRYNDSSFLVLFGGAFFGTDTFIEKNIICKLNINGSIDSSFALNGILEIPASIFSTAEQIVLSEDGSIYIMGNYAFDNFYYSVVKLNSNLTFDPGFHFVSPVGGANNFTNINIDEDGKVIVALTNFDHSFQLFRLFPDGTLDNSFNKDGSLEGYLLTDSYSIIQSIEQPDGKLLLQLRGGVTALRINPNGSFDYSFDLDGVMEKIPASYEPTNVLSSGMALQPDGKMIFIAEDDSDFIKVVRLMARP